MKPLIFLVTLLMFTEFCFPIYTQKAGKKKKIFISKIHFSTNVPPLVSRSIQNRIKLYILEKYGHLYYILSRKEIQIMYKKAMQFLDKECSSLKCARPLAEAIDADEVIFGTITSDKENLKLSFINVSRNRATNTIKTKVEVDLSFLVNEYEHYAKEITAKLLNPAYSIQKPETNKQENSTKSFPVIERENELKKIVEKDPKAQETREKINSALDDLEKIDKKIIAKKIQSVSITQLEKIIQEHRELLKSYNSLFSRKDNKFIHISNGINDRIEFFSILLVSKYVESAEESYLDFQFETKTIPIYDKALKLLHSIKNDSIVKPKIKQLETKLKKTQNTCENYVHNSVHSLLKITEYLNLKNQDVSQKMQEAKSAIMDSKCSSEDLIYSYNLLAKLTKQKRIQKKGDKEEEEKSYNPTIKNSIGMEFVLVSSGSFEMGDIPGDGDFDEKPVHIVSISKSFYLAKYPVTQEQWEKVMEENHSGFNKDKNLPVENVTWFEAKKFIKKLNKLENTTIYRLPTEAEWEFAARADSKTKYFWGDEVDKDYVWFKATSGNHTQIVGNKKPNSYGLYDMVGNVWEWCEDWYDFDYYRNSPTEDPKGPEKGMYKVIRGGAWNSGIRNLRVSDRSSRPPKLGSIAIGFRPVKMTE